MPPVPALDIHTLIPETYEYITLYCARNFADVIKDGDLEMERLFLD